jgi:hypothetical protein
MNDSQNDRLLAPEDSVFVERVRAAYAPPAMTTGRASVFDAELRERIESRGRRGTVWVPAGALAAAALAIWFGSALWGVAGPTAPVMASTWESELLLGRDVVSTDSGDYLPEDYLVIADAFLTD